MRVEKVRAVFEQIMFEGHEGGGKLENKRDINGYENTSDERAVNLGAKSVIGKLAFGVCSV